MTSILHLTKDIHAILNRVILKRDWKGFSCKIISTKSNFNGSCIFIQRLDSIGEYALYNLLYLLLISGAVERRIWRSEL